MRPAPPPGVVLPHWPVWAAHAKYTAPIPRQMYVHNLEHGWIVLSYRCKDTCPEVVAALEDPAYTVPPAAPARTGVAWLRSHVARFSEGAEHERRRALAVAILDKIDPDSLRTAPGPSQDDARPTNCQDPIRRRLLRYS